MPLLAKRFASSLQRLYLGFEPTDEDRRTKVSGFAPLQQFSKLEYLDIIDDSFEDQKVPISLANLPSSLRYLHICQMSITSDCTSFPPHLEDLYLDCCPQAIELASHLPSQLKRLQLSISDTQFSSRMNTTLSTKQISTLCHGLKLQTKLTYLALQDGGLTPSSELMTSFPSSLACLQLDKQQMSDLHKVNELPQCWGQLIKLSLVNSDLGDESLAALQSCTSLEALDLVCYCWFLAIALNIPSSLVYPLQSENKALTGKTFNLLPSSLQYLSK